MYEEDWSRRPRPVRHPRPIFVVIIAYRCQNSLLHLQSRRPELPERRTRRWQWSESNGNMSEGFVPRSVHEKKLIFGVRRGNDDDVHLLSSLSSLSFVSAAVKANDDATKPIIPRGGVVMHDRLAFAF